MKKNPIFLLVAFGFIVILNACQQEQSEYLMLKEKYSHESWLYFSETGFYDHRVLRKWEGDIHIALVGDYDSSDLRTVNEFMNSFNALSTPLQMIITERDKAQVLLIIENSTELNYNGTGYTGLTWHKTPFFSNKITNVTIRISPQIKFKERKKLIFHEMLHAIGLFDTKKMFYKYNQMGRYTLRSIDEYEEFLGDDFTLSELDKDAIKILYEQSIPIGLKRDKFLKIMQLADN